MTDKKKSPGLQKHLIEALELKAMANRSFSVRSADSLVANFGTAKFFHISLLITIVWIIINLGWFSIIKPFDPFPFILLTMVASVGAIFMTIIILVSQNRQAHINTLRSELLLQMILISERELTKALHLLANQIHSSKVNKKMDRELREMLKETNVSEIEKILENQLSNGDVKNKKN